MEINKAISNQNVIITLKGRLDTMTAPQLDDEAKCKNNPQSRA